ncbi:MAG: flavin reductase family protein [Candidatus Hermodarchaeota archaeon]
MTEKIKLSPSVAAFPMPAAVISVGLGDEANLITLAYVGKVCLSPPIIAISMQPKRHSYKLIEKHGEFVINYPSLSQLRETDYCGTRSGRNVNKWEDLKLTKEKASIVQVPMVKEFPWNMECKVINKIELGSHVCYFGEVVATHCNSELIKGDSIDPEKVATFAYISGNYISLEQKIIGKHGFSLQ